MCIELCTLYVHSLLGIFNPYTVCFGGVTDIHAQVVWGSGSGKLPELPSSA